MKVLVLGDKGFVGAAMVDAVLEAGHQPVADDGPLVRAASPSHIATLLDTHAPDVIINCVSELVSTTRPLTNMFKANILLPHALATVGVRMFQISTPHVFDGLLQPPWKYTSAHRTDATDYFGRSRALSEIVAPHVTIVRCDALATASGYVQRTLTSERVVGWTRVWWNGGFADDIARIVVGLLGVQCDHVVHVAMADGLTRYGLASRLLDAAGVRRKVEESATFVYNRMLVPTSGLELPSIEEALETHRERLVRNACSSVAHIQSARIRQDNPQQRVEESDPAQ